MMRFLYFNFLLGSLTASCVGQRKWCLQAYGNTSEPGKFIEKLVIGAKKVEGSNPPWRTKLISIFSIRRLPILEAFVVCTYGQMWTKRDNNRTQNRTRLLESTRHILVVHLTATRRALFGFIAPRLYGSTESKTFSHGFMASSASTWRRQTTHLKPKLSWRTLAPHEKLFLNFEKPSHR